MSEITALDLDELEIDSSSYVDPNGFLFRFEGGLYRGIKSQSAERYRRLFENGAIDTLSRQFGLVASRITSYTIPEADCSLVLAHEELQPISFCVEWCPSMLKAAAIHTLDLQLALLEHDLMLQDAYPWNILFSFTKPIHVDFTSIVPVDQHLLWPAYQQFCNFFLNPMHLCSMRRGGIARAMLFDPVSGIDQRRLLESVPAKSLLRRPIQNLVWRGALWTDQKIQRSARLRKQLQSRVAAQDLSKLPPLTRNKFVQRLKGKVEQLDVIPDAGIWRHYYQEVDETVESTEKANRVNQLIERLNASSVLDIGCNTGRYSIIAAKSGASVIAVDSSEACVEKVYSDAHSAGMKILPLIIDILSPTPAFGFMGTQFRSFIERAKSDVVLALGLMHHLHITGRRSFADIAVLLSTLTARACVFEFVAQDDENISRLGRASLVSYTFEHVQSALNKHFQVETFESDRPTRKLLLCSKR